MLSGYQSYSINLTGHLYLALPPFTVTVNEFPAVDKVEVSSSDERRVLVKVTFSQVGSPEDADSIARVIASQVVDRLAFEYKVSAGDPVKGDGAFQRRGSCGAIHASVSNSLCFSTAGCVTHKATPADLPGLKSAIEAPQPTKDPYFAQFRWILCQDDPVARFMHLYKILLSLRGGPKHSQKAVDAFIVGEEPGVQQVFNPHPKISRNETIYTRLRNEVGHEVPGTTPASTRQAMEQHVEKLADLVRAAISRMV